MTLPLFGKPQIADLWSQEETVVLRHGDTLQFLETLPPEFVSLVVTSPPYNLGKEYEHKKALQIYLQEQSTVIEELIRVLRHDGSICCR